MIELIEIRISDFFDEAMPLAVAHWEEVAKETGVPSPVVNKDELMQMEELGMIFTVGAFAGMELVGYSVNWIGQPFNFANITIMDNQGLFIKKQYRGSMAGIRLVDESNRLAKERGATRAKWHTYKDSRADALFESLGYAAHDLIYTKEL